MSEQDQCQIVDSEKSNISINSDDTEFRVGNIVVSAQEYLKILYNFGFMEKS